MHDPNQSDTTKRAYQLQDVEKYQLAAKGSRKSTSPISAASTGTVKSVADLFALVKQYVDNQNRLYLAVALTKMETGVVGNTASENRTRTTLVPVSAISIPELFSKINSQDYKILKYIPDEFLNGAQLEAKQMALGVFDSVYRIF